MKIIDKNGRLFGKISVIDVLVILVVAVLAVALHTKTSDKEITSGTTPDAVITYQIRAEAVPEYVADGILEGDALYEVDRSTGGSIGKIVKVESEAPGSKLAGLMNGTMVLAPVEGTVNLLITVEGNGIVSDNHYLINRIYDLGYNAARTFSNQYTQFVGNIINIEN